MNNDQKYRRDMFLWMVVIFAFGIVTGHFNL